MDDLYHQEILDHFHHPDNFGELNHPDQVIDETNASCGDVFKFYIKTKSRDQSSSDPGIDIIEDLTFTGVGCAISTAACSLLTTHLKGKPVTGIRHLNLDFMQKLIGAEITPARAKCLMLPARALSKLLDKFTKLG